MTRGSLSFVWCLFFSIFFFFFSHPLKGLWGVLRGREGDGVEGGTRVTLEGQDGKASRLPCLTQTHTTFNSIKVHSALPSFPTLEAGYQGKLQHSSQANQTAVQHGRRTECISSHCLHPQQCISRCPSNLFFFFFFSFQPFSPNCPVLFGGLPS